MPAIRGLRLDRSYLARRFYLRDYKRAMGCEDAHLMARARHDRCHPSLPPTREVAMGCEDAHLMARAPHDRCHPSLPPTREVLRWRRQDRGCETSTNPARKEAVPAGR